MYLVIGGSGFLGSYVLKAILSMTDEPVIATSRDISGFENSERLTWHQFAFNDHENVLALNSMLKKFSNVRVINCLLPAGFCRHGSGSRSAGRPGGMAG